MKYYTKQFLQSEQFYDRFYLPDISLEHHVIWENCFRKLGTHEEAMKIINSNYVSHCKDYFIKDILFYEDLSKYILDKNGEISDLDEYIFLKLRYYGTKFLNIANENRNFLEEERKRYRDNSYPEAIIALSQSRFHDADVVFEFKDNVLQMIFNPKDHEQRFKFYGIENWAEKEFMKKNPVILIEELYEVSPRGFVYNTLLCHAEVDGENHSELSIKFTDLIQTK